MIRRTLIRVFAASIVLAVALRTGSVAAQGHLGHHPDAGAADAPAATTMSPAATGMAPSTPTGVAPAATPVAPAVAGGAMGEMMDGVMAPASPDGAAGTPMGVAPTAPSAAPGAAGGAMGGMMDKMMAPASPGGAAGGAMGGCMGGGCGSSAAQTPIYPSLMTLPALTPEKRAEIDALASQNFNEGMQRLATAAESLNAAMQSGDDAAMQQSVGLMREGLDELGAGIAARRVLSEGKSPRNLALDWFKREMNLASPIAPEAPRAILGVPLFHLFTMVLLIVFALAMVAMYFSKMRRAAALFGRIEPGAGTPPPGTSPPLAGAPAPSSPATPAGGAPPASAPKSPTTPPPGSPSASNPSPVESPAIPVPEATSAPPVTANWRGQLRIGGIVTETPSVKTFRLLPFSSDGPMPFTFVPGQFLNVAFGIGGARMNRSYSISSSPNERDHVDLTVRREPRGAVSRHINDLLALGDPIETSGPVGKFTFGGTEADSVVLIAGGVGITPMMSITRYLTERSWPGDIFFVYACRAPTDFIFANEIAALQRINPRLHVTVTMSRPEGTDWNGATGRVTKELLTQTVPELASRRIHLCGPPLMMDAVKAILTELGVPAERLKTEAFGLTKPTPAAAGTTAKPTGPATGSLVTFSKNDKSSKIRVDLQQGDSPPKQSILELSEELAIGIEFSCRVGTCGICKVKMTSGEVEMAVEDALDAADKTNGVILACQAKPKSDVVVDA